MALTDQQLLRNSLLYRRRIIEIIYAAGAGHTGGSLSCVDILNALYNRILHISPETVNDPDRDRYIQSKGHSVEALYVVLAERGFFPVEQLKTLCGYRSHFVGHPTRHIPGIEHNTGALGHGLSFGVGVAIAGKLDRRKYRVFVLLGDGELAEGSNWEAAMSAAHWRLDNLVAIVDHNTLQITGRTREVCANEPLDEKFRAFGWEVKRVDGHSIGQLVDVVSADRSEQGRPLAVIADTVKGRGISFMQDQAKWHHRVPSEAEFAQALREIDDGLSRLEGART